MCIDYAQFAHFFVRFFWLHNTAISFSKFLNYEFTVSFRRSVILCILRIIYIYIIILYAVLKRKQTFLKLMPDTWVPNDREIFGKMALNFSSLAKTNHSTGIHISLKR